MWKHTGKVVFIVGFVTMLVGLLSNCSVPKPNIDGEENHHNMLGNPVKGLWVSPDGRYRMMVMSYDIIFYVDKERALDSKFTFECSGEDTVMLTEFELEDSSLKQKDDKVFAEIKRLYYENGAFNAKLVSLAGDEEWISLNETYEIQFSSFEGGGPEYFAEVSDEEVLYWEKRTRYSSSGDVGGTGTGFDFVFYFAGRKPGTADVVIKSLIRGDEYSSISFKLVVDENYHITRIDS